MSKLLYFLTSLSIKSRLIILQLCITLASVAIVAFSGGVTQRDALSAAAFDTLVDRRDSRASEVVLYITSLRSKIHLLSRNSQLVSASTAFAQAFERLAFEPLNPLFDDALEDYYVENVLSAETDPDTAQFFLPQNRDARLLQYRFLTGGNDSDWLYDETHARYDVELTALAAELGLSNLFIVSLEEEVILYSTEKTTDLGTSLLTGTYNSSHLATVVSETKRRVSLDTVEIADFANYEPIDQPVAFIATAIRNSADAPIGIVVGQLAPDGIDAILTDNQAWAEAGAGETGETYVVGPDRLLRTSSRFQIEDPETYIADLRVNGQSEETLAAISATNRSILLQSVNTFSVSEALNGRSGTGTITDYRGQEVLTAYRPLTLDGLNWAIVAEIDVAEAFAPVVAVQRQIFVTSILLVVGVTLLAMLAASVLTRPIKQLTQAIAKIQAGEKIDKLAEPRDEFGALTHAVNNLTEHYHNQTEALQQRTGENQQLLASLVPPPVAQRIQRGDEQVAEKVQQVTVLVGRLSGVVGLLNELPSDEAITLFDALLTRIDAVAEHFDLERQRHVGDQIVLVCNLMTPHLDHMQRTFSFATTLFDELAAFNDEHEIGLGLRIGIHSGPIFGGVLGGHKFFYNMWGEAVNGAVALCDEAERNTILMSELVFSRLETNANIKKLREIQVDEIGLLTVFVQSRQTKITRHQIDLVQSSYAKILPIGDIFATAFYERLFELAPEVRPMFPDNMEQQRRKLMSTLNIVVGGLNVPEKILDPLYKLGRRHIGYEVIDEQYPIVGEALIDALAGKLRRDFTPAMRDAWLATYNFAAEAMMEGAAQGRKAAQNGSSGEEDSADVELPV